jgi:hypothetical protein
MTTSQGTPIRSVAFDEVVLSGNTFIAELQALYGVKQELATNIIALRSMELGLVGIAIDSGTIGIGVREIELTAIDELNTRITELTESMYEYVVAIHKYFNSNELTPVSPAELDSLVFEAKGLALMVGRTRGTFNVNSFTSSEGVEILPSKWIATGNHLRATQGFLDALDNLVLAGVNIVKLNLSPNEYRSEIARLLGLMDDEFPPVSFAGDIDAIGQHLTTINSMLEMYNRRGEIEVNFPFSEELRGDALFEKLMGRNYATNKHSFWSQTGDMVLGIVEDESAGKTFPMFDRLFGRNPEEIGDEDREMGAYEAAVTDEISKTRELMTTLVTKYKKYQTSSKTRLGLSEKE